MLHQATIEFSVLVYMKLKVLSIILGNVKHFGGERERCAHVATHGICNTIDVTEMEAEETMTVHDSVAALELLTVRSWPHPPKGTVSHKVETYPLPPLQYPSDDCVL